MTFRSYLRAIWEDIQDAWIVAGCKDEQMAMEEVEKLFQFQSPAGRVNSLEGLTFAPLKERIMPPIITMGGRRIHGTEFHQAMAAQFSHAAATGQVPVGNASERWRLCWLCSSPVCGEVHAETGDIHETISTFLILLQFGYPWIRIENAGFVEVAAAEGLEGDLKAAARAYRDFLEHTQP